VEVNTILFRGTGRVQGIEGNKNDPRITDDACFEAIAQDIAEPGTRGAKDGPFDKYYIRIERCSDHTFLLGLGGAEQENWVDVTTGNVQLHPCH
jgi:hypothetical protein